MDEFFKIASDALVDHDAIVDTFVGDEVIGIFVPILASSDHAAQAIGAARQLQEGLAARQGPPLPVGTGVHTGVAFVGAVGSDSHVDVTAMGDPVNVTARLASAAGPDEILVSTQAASTAGLDTTGLEQRALELKGKSQSTTVFVLV